MFCGLSYGLVGGEAAAAEQQQHTQHTTRSGMAECGSPSWESLAASASQPIAVTAEDIGRGRAWWRVGVVEWWRVWKWTHLIRMQATKINNAYNQCIDQNK